MINIIKRKDALHAGLKRYFTGKPCKHGHIAERLAECGVCSVCSRKSVDRYTENNKDKISGRMKVWRDKTPEYFNEWYDTHKEQHQQYTKTWKINNPEKLALLVKKRRNLLKLATPCWYESDLINRLFKKRDELSIHFKVDLTVDHIIPLQGEGVCGLHCWDNLQLLDRQLNGQKRNRYEPNW